MKIPVNQLPYLLLISFLSSVPLLVGLNVTALGRLAADLSIHDDVPAIIGGGNIGKHLTRAKPQFEALNTIGAGMCRIPVSPSDYGLNTGQPRPERLDELILLAHQHGIEPVLLFEYYTRWHPKLHDHARWFAIGHAYARRLRPNSAWLISKGIRNWFVG